MYLKSFILSLIIIGFPAINYFAEGLQCYVCEDCNEKEDFKELQICGEIPRGLTTIRTTTTPLLEVTEEGSSATKSTIKSNSQRPLSQPTTTDDYFYKDKNETNKQNSNKKTTKKPITTKATTTTQNQTSSPKFTTQAPAIEVTKPLTESSATKTLVEGTTMVMKPTTTQQALVTNNIIKPTLTITTTTAKSILTPDYDDYLEYEDSNSRSDKSLLKINEPVCYMIKYQVNNTILTNRGCTTFINASKYLTCQSLYNGAPMESCRICSSNGCNKFIEDETDYADVYDNSKACTLQLYGIFMLFLGILLNHFIF